MKFKHWLIKKLGCFLPSEVKTIYASYLVPNEDIFSEPCSDDQAKENLINIMAPELIKRMKFYKSDTKYEGLLDIIEK